MRTISWFVGSMLVITAFVSIATQRPALAQAGSIGGTIGKTDKSASGGQERPERPNQTIRPHQKEAVETTTVQKKATGCPNIVGAWDSWASGIFGKGDATFNEDGTATHRSGIPGKWWCENGQLHIEWADGRPGLVKVSRDGKKIISAGGGIHASRD